MCQPDTENSGVIRSRPSTTVPFAVRDVQETPGYDVGASQHASIADPLVSNQS